MGARRAARMYRGSHKRLKRIKWQENTPLGFWVCVLLLLVIFVVMIAWSIKRAPANHAQRSAGSSGSGHIEISADCCRHEPPLQACVVSLLLESVFKGRVTPR